VQIARGNLVTTLEHTGWVILRCDNMKQYNLGMKVAGQIRRLLHRAPRNINENYRYKNFVNIHRSTPIATNI
jgi:hypothetical protein